MIVSLFGPDGVGKSTISKKLKDLGYLVVSGTGVASWPDQTWHKELTSQGIDDTTLDERGHFYEKISRLHEMARELERQKTIVIVDSAPFHKTLMHDYIRASDETSAVGTLKGNFDLLFDIAKFDLENYIHVHCHLASNSSENEQARILHQRISARGRIDTFDPKSVEQSEQMIRACRLIVEQLRNRGAKVKEIDMTDDWSEDEIANSLGLANRL